MNSPLHTGHRPGPVSRSRFLKTKPHPRHAAGSCSRRRPAARKDLLKWTRCPATSRSGMRAEAEISLAVRGLSSSRARIRRRTVS